MVRKLGQFTLILGSILFVLGFGEPAYVQGPEEGWQIYTDDTSVSDVALAGGGALGGGYAWAATRGGVVCYNASEQVTFTVLDGLADNNVSTLAEDDEGRWWFGTYGGVSVLDDGGTPLDKGDDTWGAFSESDGLAHNWVWAVTADDEGRWWFGTYGGVSVLDDGGTLFDKGNHTWATFTESDGLASNYVYDVIEDGSGRWWFGTYGGVSVLDDRGTLFNKIDDIWTAFATADGLTGDNYIEAIVEDDRGRLWFADNGVSVLDDGRTSFDKSDDKWTRFAVADGLAHDWVYAIAVDGSGRWWFGTYSGVSVLDDGGTPFDKGDDRWATFTTADGLVSNGPIRRIIEDDAERLWFSTWDGGASVLDYGGTPFDKGDDRWISFTTLDGLADNHIQALAEDNAGRLWFSIWDSGVMLLDHGGTPFDKDDDVWMTFTMADGLPDHYVLTIVEDDEGKLWFGTNNGVSVLDHGGTPFDKSGDIWITLTESDGLVNDYAYAIIEDDEGRWWFGTAGGVSVLDGGDTPFDKSDDVWTSFTTADGVAHRFLTAIVVDGEGRRWFGTVGGASVLVDAVAPTSSASSPAYASGAIPVSWSANDGTSGVVGVSLWVKAGSGGSWTDTGLRQRGVSAGTFTYTPTQGDGTYYFATVAEDWLGNVEVIPTGSGDSRTVYSVVDARDGYEVDDTCAQARAISTSGAAQVHSFHDPGDADWVTFDVVASTDYLIEAQIPGDSPADVVLELYDRCDGTAQDDQDHAFSPGVRYEFQAPADGRLYLKLFNHDPAVYGADVAYQLSVQMMEEAPTPGAVVIVGGRLRAHDEVQPNIHAVTDAVYRLFLARGYGPERIHYLATELALDADGDGMPDVDGLPTRENVQQAITQWAIDKVDSERPFTLYLMDHGDHDRFYLDGHTRWLDPGSLDGWLDALEAAVPGVEVNVIVEACYSGSFIDLAATVSKAGRVVISSTGAHNLAWATGHGAAFSDPFLQALGSGMSLYESFQEARWAVQVAHPDQTPWLDDDGDGAPNGGVDGQEGSRRGFAFSGASDDAWSPWVVWSQIVEVQGSQGTIEAEVRDDGGVAEVWAVVYPPSYQPPASGEELVLEDLPVVTLLDGDGDGIYIARYDGFTEAGTYRVVVYAADEEGLVGRPEEAELYRIYLPLALK